MVTAITGSQYIYIFTGRSLNEEPCAQQVATQILKNKTKQMKFVENLNDEI